MTWIWAYLRPQFVLSIWVPVSIAIIIAFLVITFVLVTSLIASNISLKGSRNEVKSLQNDNTSLLNQLNYSNGAKDVLTNKLVDLNEELEVLKAAKVDNDTINKLRSELAALEDRKSILNDLVDERTRQLVVLNDNINTVEQNKLMVENEINNLTVALNEKRNNLSSVENELVAAKNTFRIVNNDGQEDRGGRITVNGNEERLIKLIDEISSCYPELKMDLAKLIWSKVWLGKMQTLVKSLNLIDGVSGIYKLEDAEGKVYVGQAVDIKNRWYTHAKKMIGAEVVGNERLYSSGKLPSEWRWSVVEEVEDNKLNDKERYWIEFWKSDVDGYNMKR